MEKHYRHTNQKMGPDDAGIFSVTMLMTLLETVEQTQLLAKCSQNDADFIPPAGYEPDLENDSA